MIWDRINCFLKKAVSYAKENRLLVFFLTVFCLGIVFGGFSIRYFEANETDLSNLFQQFVSLRTRAFTHILFSSLFSCVFPVFLLYCFGLFVYGYVPCFLLLFVQGITHGVVCGYIYSTYGLKGVAFVLLVVLPPAFIGTIILLVGSKVSFQFAVILSKTYFSDMVLVQPTIYFKRYHCKYLILLGFAMFAALADSLLSRVFIHVFGF